MFFFERSGFVSKSSHNMSITDEKKCFYSQSGEDTRLANISKIVESGAVGKEITVPVVTVDSILSQSGVTTLDFVTVDVEGAELGVLRGFDLKKWNPRVLVLEDNFQGHDRRVRRYLCSQGYRCFLSDGLNDWYARTDDNELFTVRRRFAQFRRQFRVRLYEITVGLL